MIAVDYQHNLKDWLTAIDEYKRQFGKTAKQAFMFQLRLLAQKLVEHTPPPTRSRGMVVVEKDIRRVVLGLKKSEQKKRQKAMDAGLLTKGEQGDIQKLWVTKDGRVYGAQKEFYRPDASEQEIGAWHWKNRTKNGRVSKAGTYTRDIGRWKFIDRLVVNESTLKSYIRNKQMAVGRAKGGWAASLIRLKASGSQWYMMHARHGSFIDETDGSNPGNLAFTFQNRSEWAMGNNEGDTNRKISNALASRAQIIRKSIEDAHRKAQAQSKLAA